MVGLEAAKGDLQRLAVHLALLATVLELSVSANLLTWIGVPYVTEGGSFILKLHPGTYLLLGAFMLLLAAGTAGPILASQPLLLIFLTSIAASLLYLLALTGKGNTIVIIDTFLPAGILAIVMSHASCSQLQRSRSALQMLIAANAMMALGEIVVHATLIPLYLNDAAYRPHSDDFRPTALYDHPLTGAVMTLLGMALPPAGRCRSVAYFGLLWAALFAFGGRIALGAAVGFTCVLAGVHGARLLLLRDRRIAGVFLRSALAIAAAAVLGACALYAGLGARLAGHLYWDGSAQVRLAQWQILNHLDVWQILFGTRRDDLLALLTPLRLGPGVEVIENFWLLMFVAFGCAGIPLFLVGLLSLILWCWRKTELRGRLLIAAVMLVASTSNSLGRKSSILICLVATIMCLPAGVHVSRAARKKRWQIDVPLQLLSMARLQVQA